MNRSILFTSEENEPIQNRDRSNRENNTQTDRERREKNQPLHFRDTRRPAEQVVEVEACN
jgi:hypothetical protein